MFHVIAEFVKNNLFLMFILVCTRYDSYFISNSLWDLKIFTAANQPANQIVLNAKQLCGISFKLSFPEIKYNFRIFRIKLKISTIDI